jgi:hypothetical protein
MTCSLFHKINEINVFFFCENYVSSLTLSSGLKGLLGFHGLIGGEGESA